VGPLQSRTAS
ncbi:hypothetical protein PC112_g7879, partial [Phytophthora cactorum]